MRVVGSFCELFSVELNIYEILGSAHLFFTKEMKMCCLWKQKQGYKSLILKKTQD